MSEQLVWRSAVEQAALVAARRISARDLVEAHLERIAAVNPAINAIVTLVPERALAEAGELDRRLAAGEPPAGSLHGLPIAVKDLVETAGIRTTQGSPLFADSVPEEDALLVRRLRAAGAVVIGKTNTPEFGAGSHTFNPVFGATRNPWDLTRSAGGSSGGAAAAVASGMLPLADGSDMGGSLRNPAAFCGVCGLRPSPGRWPAWPRLDPFDALSVTGPIARSVGDLRLLLEALAGPDGRSPLAPPPAAPRSARRPRVGWSPDLGGLPVDPDVAAVLAAAPALLEAAGFDVEPVELDLAGADEAFETLRAISFAAELADVVAAHRDRVKRTVVENVERGLALTGGEVAAAVALRGRLFADWCGLMERFDAIAAPAAQVAPFPVEVEWPAEVAGTRMGSYIEWMRACTRISVTAHPALSVPCGFTAGGLPVGLQLAGRLGGEHALLDLAAAFEAVSPAAGRRPPEPRA
jgi:amidase